jgi:hypothetical protein
MIRLFICIGYIASNGRGIVANLKDELVAYFKELLQHFPREAEYQASIKGKVKKAKEIPVTGRGGP